MSTDPLHNSAPSAAAVLQRKTTIGQLLRTTGDIPVTRLLTLARRQWRALAVGSVFLAIGSAAGLAWPQAIRWMMDGAFGEGGVEEVDRAALILLGVFVVQGIAIGLRSYLFTVAGERIVSDLRQDLFSQMLDQEVGFFDQNHTGKLISRLASDTATLQNTVSVNVSMGLRHVAMAVGGIGLLVYTSPLLTALMLLVVPPVAVGAVVYGRRIRRLSNDVQVALADANHVAEESIAGVRTVRAFAAEDIERGRYGVAIERSFDIAKVRARLSAMFAAVASIAAYAAVSIVLWYGGRVVVDGGMSVGELTSFVIYTLTVAFALGALGSLWADFMRAAGAGQRVFELLDRQAEIANRGGLIPEQVSGHVRIEGVCFRYPGRPDVEVLRDVSVALEPGEVVALVGPSGGGKSTIAALLSRIYDPDSGRITLDGRDIRELDATWLRHQVGVVAQEPLLFSASVKDNIRYGRPDASDDEVRDAAVAANADAFIRGFPEGYDTSVGERGVQLSGGQKQRVAIARALLRNPSVLLLDEATSALDAESEHLVQTALERLMKGRTTLVIAHRLSTVRRANRVVVIDGGAVADAGGHDELMARGGLYKRLVERQLTAA